jgi:hypothetical protein
MVRALPTREPLKPLSSSDKIRELVTGTGGGEAVEASHHAERKTSRLTANIRADLMSWLRGEALKEAAANPDARNTTTIRDLIEEAIELLQNKRK